MDLEQLPLGEEVECLPGVILQRRSFMALASTVLAGMALPGMAQDSQKALKAGRLSLEQFLAEVAPLAKQFVTDKSPRGQDRYLHHLAQYAVHLAEVAQPKLRPSSQGKHTSIGFIPGGEPFVVLYWHMEPNTVIRPHAHTYGNVLTVALKGETLVENYEMLEAPNFTREGDFEVQRTGRVILKPGQTAAVNLDHGYIHGFKAGPNGAAGLDLTTRLKPKPDHSTPYLRLGKPNPQGFDRYQAAWYFDPT